MKKYLSYLHHKNTLLFGLCFGIGSYYLFTALFIFQPIDLNNPLLWFYFSTPCVIFVLALYWILLRVGHDLKNVRYHKQNLTKKELFTLYRNLSLTTFVLCLFTNQTFMIINIVINLYLLLMLRDFYYKKVSPYLSSLLFFLIYLGLGFYFSQGFMKVVFNNPYFIVILLISFLLPLVTVTLRRYLIRRRKYEVTIKRDSISKKDSGDHALKITVNGLTTFEDFIKMLVKKSYFPKVYGDDEVWLVKHHKEEVGVFVRNTKMIYSFLIRSSDTIEDLLHSEEDLQFYASFYSSAIQRAEFLYRTRFGKIDEEHVKEYQDYAPSKVEEAKWQ